MTEEKRLSAVSRLAFVFDQTNANWRRFMPDHNEKFLLDVERYCNEQLNKNDFITLNDVLQELGFAPTFRGLNHGWWIAAEHEDAVGFYVTKGHNGVFLIEFEGVEAIPSFIFGEGDL